LKILVLSSLYPPHYVGGYELGCREVAEALKRRGHTIRVLTSTYGVGRPEDDGEVYRWLQSDLGWRFTGTFGNRLRLVGKELRNRRAFRRMVRDFQPDVLYVWPIRYISLSLVFMAQQMSLPVAFYVSDDWLSRWQSIDQWQIEPNQPGRRTIKRALARLVDLLGGAAPATALDARHAQFTSEHIRRAAQARGQPVERARVIHWGVDLARFPYRQAARPEVRRLLYVGQLAPPKGVHTAIEALALLRERCPERDLTLTLAGGTIFPDYAERLHALVRELGLEGAVHFTGMLPREQLPAIYQDHDLLVFPSSWDEPFSITLLEGLASGLAVVGTGTGGSAEILRDGENALVFPREDAAACAAQIERLVRDPALAERLRQAGRRTVERSFRIEAMIDQIEAALRAAAQDQR
jgi:glycosyltransferase involved in cell wall biosynthesis